MPLASGIFKPLLRGSIKTQIANLTQVASHLRIKENCPQKSANGRENKQGFAPKCLETKRNHSKTLNNTK
jgi:hypothetical protein